MTTGQLFLTGWKWGGATVPVGAGTLVFYLSMFGFHRRFAYFAGALGLALITLLSPIDALADGCLFSAHMLQHIILLLIVPALVLLSIPRSISLAIRPRILGSPLLGWIAGVGAMWFWHAPALCNAAISSRPIHTLQTVSLLALGCVFWRQILAPRENERLSPPHAILYLFGACVTCGILGIIITFSPVEVCSIYSIPQTGRLGALQSLCVNWGMTPERDQQIGGLIMWVPMCLVYLSAILAQIARWFAESGNRATEEI